MSKKLVAYFSASGVLMSIVKVKISISMRTSIQVAPNQQNMKALCMEMRYYEHIA